MALSDKLIDAEAFARWGDMKGAPLAMCRGFARAIEVEARRDALEEAAKKCEALLAEHTQALAFLAGLYCGDLTISDPPMAVAERIFDSVMDERAGLKDEIKRQEQALDFLRNALAKSRQAPLPAA